MTYSLRFVPQVEGDLAQGYTWYEFKSAGLGEDFLRAFFASASEISDHPLAWPSVHGAFRRRLLRRFPYAVYFTADAESAVVFGVRIPVNPATSSGGKRPPKPKQGGHPSERSDAGC